MLMYYCIALVFILSQAHSVFGCMGRNLNGYDLSQKNNSDTGYKYLIDHKKLFPHEASGSRASNNNYSGQREDKNPSKK